MHTYATLSPVERDLAERDAREDAREAALADAGAALVERAYTDAVNLLRAGGDELVEALHDYANPAQAIEHLLALADPRATASARQTARRFIARQVVEYVADAAEMRSPASLYADDRARLAARVLASRAGVLTETN